MRKVKLAGLILLAIFMLALPVTSPAQVSVGISVHIGPPALPVYAQPICPGPGYIWTPGYWAYGPDGYYWVPGTWVIAPAVGLLWTPGYWGWGGGVYVWHAGYWGPHVGFYGGINYGFGYVGAGYVGGYWNHGVFAYNTAVTNVNTTVIHNTYVNKTVINNVTVNHVSYNGGTGGTTAQPTGAEREAENEHHIAPTSMQAQHEHAASTNRALLASENHGRPSIAATSKPGEFKGRGVVAASAASHNVSPNGGNRPNNAAELHRSDRAPSAHGSNAPSNASHGNGGNSSHLNNAAQTQRNTPHAENRPHPENKPREENKPRPENKPEHREPGKPHYR
ncbi:MAG TPA: YXWGXW repeat-containing protein [Candidatus Methylomirabilis sp.]|nr:YXWGXW repeat-containing protein [Candidatus Methylomirabilis sp.]